MAAIVDLFSARRKQATGPRSLLRCPACGQECAICNDFECFFGYCDEVALCQTDAPPACAIHTLCYEAAPDRMCAPPRTASQPLCEHCQGGKGCSFSGQVLAGPF